MKARCKFFKARQTQNGIFAALTLVTWVLLIVTIVFLGSAMYYYITGQPIEPVFKKVITTLHIGDNTWDWIAVSFACLSLFYTCLTFNSQRKTEQNTKKITKDSQREILIDYVRHFYCNLIIICAVEAKLDKRFDDFYPSEEHLLKLKVDTADLTPDSAAFSNHLDEYKAIHELLLKVRNFNTEVDVAVMHLGSRDVFPPAKQRDLDTLKFKMGYLTQEIVAAINTLWPDNQDENIAVVKSLIERTGESRNQNAHSQREAYSKRFGTTYPYYSNNKSFFVSGLFTTAAERAAFFRQLNFNIYVEIMAANVDGSDKIFMIPFKNDR